MSAYEQVDVYVKTKAEPNTPVEGVLVRVYEQDGSLIFSEAATDADGHVGFLLWSGKTYSLRFYKFQVGFTQPQLIEVKTEVMTPGTTPNTFDVEAEVLEFPVANDSRLCRASGYFRDITGAPYANLDMHFRGRFPVALLEGSGVVNATRIVRTDDDGYACVDLVRCALYEVTMETLEGVRRCIKVPDAPSVNLPDLLFAKVEAVGFEPEGPFQLTVGGELELVTTVVGTDGVPLDGPAIQDVLWKTSDNGVFSFTTTATGLLLRGVGVGTAELQAERKDESIVSIPAAPISGVPIAVVVT